GVDRERVSAPMNLETKSYSLPLPIKTNNLTGFSILHPPLAVNFVALWVPLGDGTQHDPPRPPPTSSSIAVWLPLLGTLGCPKRHQSPEPSPPFPHPQGRHRTSPTALDGSAALPSSPFPHVRAPRKGFRRNKRGGAASERAEVPPQPRWHGRGAETAERQRLPRGRHRAGAALSGMSGKAQARRRRAGGLSGTGGSAESPRPPPSPPLPKASPPPLPPAPDPSPAARTAPPAVCLGALQAQRPLPFAPEGQSSSISYGTPERAKAPRSRAAPREDSAPPS
ncbi:unnamed protein product, partial [Coccothraustes coccothraustes]